MEKIKTKYRELTFKRMTGLLTDSETEWLEQATKALYGRFARSAEKVPTKFRINKLLETMP